MLRTLQRPHLPRAQAEERGDQSPGKQLAGVLGWLGIPAVGPRAGGDTPPERRVLVTLSGLQVVFTCRLVCFLPMNEDTRSLTAVGICPGGQRPRLPCVYLRLP